MERRCSFCLWPGGAKGTGMELEVLGLLCKAAVHDLIPWNPGGYLTYIR